MISAVLVLLAGATEVVVMQGVELDAATRQVLRGHSGNTLVDATSVFVTLFEAPHDAPPFEDFRAAPPAGWPRELEQTWDQAMRTCRQAMAQERLSCAISLRAPLWQRFLEFQAPGRVTVALARFGEHGAWLEVSRFDVRASSGLRVSQSVTRESAQRVMAQAVATLAMGEGTSFARKVPGPVPTAPPTVRTLKVQGLLEGSGRVELKECLSLPGKLEFDEVTPVSVDLAWRWERSVSPGRGGAVRCTLEERFGVLPEGPLEQTSTLTLRCGAARAHAAPAVMTRPPRAEEVLAPMLSALSTQLCAR